MVESEAQHKVVAVANRWLKPEVPCYWSISGITPFVPQWSG